MTIDEAKSLIAAKALVLAESIAKKSARSIDLYAEGREDEAHAEQVDAHLLSAERSGLEQALNLLDSVVG